MCKTFELRPMYASAHGNSMHFLFLSRHINAMLYFKQPMWAENIYKTYHIEYKKHTNLFSFI